VKFVEEVYAIKKAGTQVNENDPQAAEYIDSSASECGPLFWLTPF
jgi:hypothetical protein